MGHRPRQIALIRPDEAGNGSAVNCVRDHVERRDSVRRQRIRRYGECLT
jgi:hypothetical protein